MTQPNDDAPSVPLEAMGRDSLGRDAAPWLAPARLAIGMLQGLGLFWLHRASDGVATWPATQPLLFGPLLLVLGFLPVMLLAGVSRLRLTTLAIWAGVAAASLALLGLHDIARQSADTLQGPPFLSPPVILFAAAGLFIAHHLVAPADMERRRIASYPAYFDTATKSLVQLALSIGFTAAFWALLHLGAALFRIIGLDFLEDLLGKDWFYIPVTFLVFAVAVHLTDVRDGLIRGVRTVALMLLSWLLLVMTVIVAGFVAALPFTGLQGLWETGNATALVLAAAAALVILINAAYQDGRPDNRPPAVLRVAVRVAAVLIAPLVVIAFWGLALRVGQYGLTPDRIIAAACAVVGAAFAVGYGWAALSPFWRKGEWMRPLERATIWTGVLALALILALFSPLLDPARLSVTDQVARLQRGAVTPDRFDYHFLRFESGKAGQAALARLARSGNADIAARTRAARSATDRHDPALGPRHPQVIEMSPAGSALPADFLTSVEGRALRGCDAAGDCVAALRDVNGDGTPEVLLARAHGVQVFARIDPNRWAVVGSFDPAVCQGRESADLREAFRAGRSAPVASAWPDLVLGIDSRARFTPDPAKCGRAPVSDWLDRFGARGPAAASVG
ncbi:MULTISPECIES: DUF4153 domain-containing protein [unclassified Brevundimonas]|uniref:DUF4153 domain-containing protein n=1 Tax=unclassified Brevundimonas TaxID=2622653 RepID=UPI0007006BCD|nr:MULTISPECIES: DUF4153 domain-containing protein [unclassified Brevundimonas]KQY84447.1 hypothetical protein ASD25_23940 [Brevundimonas sp. Root1423]KRA19773.1 hypothetical protein ASD59_12355 [Brevundimonas sp. Root608]